MNPIKELNERQYSSQQQMMKLHHDESPNIVSVDVRSLIQSQDKSQEDNDTLEFPISQENVVLELDQNEKLLQAQKRDELDELKWDTDQLFTGPTNSILDLKQEYLIEDNQQSAFDAARISERLSGMDNRHSGRLDVSENRINELPEEKPITSTAKIKRPKFSCKDCSFIGINKYDIIRHRRAGYRYFLKNFVADCNITSTISYGPYDLFYIIMCILDRQIHLGPPTKRHQCNQCDFSTVWKSNYNLHMPWVQKTLP